MENMESHQEMRQHLFELTLALYRVTDFFPQGEALRKHLREKANEILGIAAEYKSGEDKNAPFRALSKIQAVKSYLGIARSMRFVNPINLAVLEREYNFLADFFAEESKIAQTPQKSEETKPAAGKKSLAQTLPEQEPEKLSTWDEFAEKEKIIDSAKDNAKSPANLNERQQKMLQHIKEANGAKISDFFPVFADISSKTIQRDLQDLVSKNMLKKEGEKRWTVYSLA